MRHAEYSFEQFAVYGRISSLMPLPSPKWDHFLVVDSEMEGPVDCCLRIVEPKPSEQRMLMRLEKGLWVHAIGRWTRHKRLAIETLYGAPVAGIKTCHSDMVHFYQRQLTVDSRN